MQCKRNKEALFKYWNSILEFRAFSNSWMFYNHRIGIISFQKFQGWKCGTVFYQSLLQSMAGTSSPDIKLRISSSCMSLFLTVCNEESWMSPLVHFCKLYMSVYWVTMNNLCPIIDIFGLSFWKKKYSYWKLVGKSDVENCRFMVD